MSDRMKDALLALLGSATPRIDFFTTYRARVVSQSSDFTKVDIKPDDIRVPSRNDVRIKWGIPGVTCQIEPGAFVQHGWENGDPSKPYVMLCESGATVDKLVLNVKTGGKVFLGGEGGAKALATKEDVDNHTHTFTYVPGTSGTATAATDPPDPITGTQKTEAQ